MSTRTHILVVEDEPALRQAIRRILSASHEVVAAGSADEAEGLLALMGRCDLILSDFSMPGRDGLELAAGARSLGYRGPVLMMSGMVHDAIDEALAQGLVSAVIRKPWSLDELREVVSRWCEAPAPTPAAVGQW